MDDEFDENAEGGDMGSPEPDDQEEEGEGEAEGDENNEETTEFLDAAEAAEFKRNKLSVPPKDRSPHVKSIWLKF